jgi:hypothetical protein
MSRKLIKQFPIPFSRKKLACVLTCGLSTSSSSSTSICASTKQPVVKAKRYSNRHKKCKTKIQLPVMKRINPFSLLRWTFLFPLKLLSLLLLRVLLVMSTSPKLPSYDESTFCFSQTDLDSFLLDSYIFPAIKAQNDYSISRPSDDDQQSLISSDVFDGMQYHEPLLELKRYDNDIHYLVHHLNEYTRLRKHYDIQYIM